METILNPKRLAPLVKAATRVALDLPHVQPALARAGRLLLAVRANPAVKATSAGAGFLAGKLKASPSLSGLIASGLAILIFIAASPVIFPTLAPTPGSAPATAGTNAPGTPAPAPGLVLPPSAPGAAGKEPAIIAPLRPPGVRANPEPFIERFTTLDESRWYVADRGPNGDWTANDFRRSQLGLAHDGLSVTLAKTTTGRPPSYTSGEISTLQKFRYGYFEARLRTPRGSGLDTGLFTYVRDKGPTGWNEIDIEFVGKNARQVELTLHVGKQVAHHIVQLAFDPSQGFHTYGFDWQPKSVSWYIDNQKVVDERGPVAAGLIRPQNFIFDVWGSETLPMWLGKIDPSGGPFVATIACFAYAKSYDGRALCADPDARVRGAGESPRELQD